MVGGSFVSRRVQSRPHGWARVSRQRTGRTHSRGAHALRPSGPIDSRAADSALPFFTAAQRQLVQLA